uniref:HECT-type E3 ubiquitin transferase n=1 Tax=Ditylum brightwellii TaxID=49249 RepID=A0A7S4S0Y2_9STRA
MSCDLLLRLKSHLLNEIGGNDCHVAAGREREFAALCHAAVIFMRALPRARPLVLRHGLVGCLLQCVRNVLVSLELRKDGNSTAHNLWPRWLAPALLFLDVMAQPTAVSLDSEIDNDSQQLDNAGGGGRGKRSEYARVMTEHKKQTAILSKGAKHIFLALNGKHEHHVQKKKKEKEKEAKKQDDKLKEEKESTKKDNSKSDGEPIKKSDEDSASTSDASFISASIPSYLPLIPPETAELCMLLSLQILGVRSKQSNGNGGVDDADIPMFAPPGVTHAALLLLTRVLRSHKLASQCLRMGGAELLLSLPSESRFTGNTGLATVFLRRMLEDEATLQTAMETEIRGTVAKLHKKQNRGSTRDNDRPRVTSRSFMQSMTPLICRNPLVFLKAAATSVRVDPVTTGSGSGQKRIVLLSAEERAKNIKALDSYFRNNTSSAPSSSGNNNSGQSTKKQSLKGHVPGSSPPHKRGRSTQKTKSPQISRSLKSKSPHRSLSRRGSSPKKTPKKEKQEKSNALSTIHRKKQVALNGTPANHITSLLLTEIINLTEANELEGTNLSSYKKEKVVSNKSFLWTVDHLEILADLVLAVPACAAAIHRYRPPTAKTGTKEVSGSATHPNTAVSFLLHRLLPQTRIAGPKQIGGADCNESSDSDTNSDKLENRKQEAYMKVKIAQTTARLLVALVARAGEGRRRVVTDLACALSGGTSHSSPTVKSNENEEKEMWALLSWGELCIGLAAPRSSSISQDHHQSLSYEVVKLMLECGMAHALMQGVQRVKLHHPMAPTVASALLRPLEVFSRGSVVDTVFTMVEKEEEEKKKLTKKKSLQGVGINRESSIGPSQRSETSFADDAMLEDGFDAETAERNARQNARQNDRRRHLRQMIEGAIEMDDDDLTEELGVDEEFSVDSESSDEDNIDDEDDDDGDSIALEDSDHSDDEEEESESDDEEDSDDSSSESDSEEEEESDDGMEEDESEVDDDDDEDEGANVEAEEEEFGWDGEEEDDFLEGNDDELNDDDNEGGGVESEMDIEEGWTRIDSSGLGGMLLGVRQRGPSDSNTHRQRAGGFIVDAAEAMIGNILRAGDIQLEALAEIEDTLGIRIMAHRVDSEQRNSRLGPLGGTSIGTNNGSSNGAGGGNLNSTSRGSVGTLPAVFQHVPPDSGYTSASTGGRWGEINSMEYSYGGPTIGAGSRNYDLADNQEQETPRDFLRVPATVDTQLFPGGPAASTHSRTQQCLHSLLSGVELPPFNALVLNLRPHSEQSTADLGPSSSLAMGTTLISSSNGNIIRLNRGPGESIMENQQNRSSATGSAIGLGSWTDDGQPLDSTTGEFSLAFERALGETIARNSDSNVASTEESTTNEIDRSHTNNTVGNESPPSEENTETVAAGGQEAQTISQPEPEAPNNEPAANSGTREDMDQSAPSTSPSDEGNENTNNNEGGVASSSAQDVSQSCINEGNISEGEVVASSLANGLTLSPRDESSSISVEEASRPNLTSRDGEAAAVASTPSNETENPPGEVDDNDSSQGMDISEQNQAEPLPASSDRGATASSIDHVDSGTSNNDAVNAGSTLDSETRGEAPSGEHPADGDENAPNENGLVCPSGMDLEVFNSLPLEMQQEVIEQHQATMNVATQLDSTSSLDPEALAALPEEMRREVIAQEQQERRMREQTPADPANAEEMDNASFVASLAPDLREEILLAADDTFLNSLPPDIIAEAQILRERASSYHRRRHEENAPTNVASGAGSDVRSAASQNDEQTNNGDGGGNAGGTTSSSRKKNRLGKLKLECDRPNIIYMPPCVESKSGALVTSSSMKTIIRLMYLLSPVHPQRLLQKLVQNFCTNTDLRRSFLTTFVALLNDDPGAAVQGVRMLEEEGVENNSGGSAGEIDVFPPSILIGTAPEVSDADPNSSNIGMFRRRSGGSTAAAFAANLPASARGSSNDEYLPPVVAKRIINTLSFLTKSSHRVCLDVLGNAGQYCFTEDESGMVFDGDMTCLDRLLDLLDRPLYTKSSTNLEQLLGLLECVVNPLSNLPRDSDHDHEMIKKDADTCASGGKEWVEIPRPLISHHRLQLLCKILRMESCKDSSFVKVNNIAKRLCRIEANRDCILRELAAVAQGLGVDAIRDLRSLSIRLNDAAKLHQEQLLSEKAALDNKLDPEQSSNGGSSTSQSTLLSGTPSSAVTLSTSSSELRLLRVLQALHTLCGDTLSDDNGKKSEGTVFVTQELVTLLQSINLELLWDQLTSCLRVVSVLEGVARLDEVDEKGVGENNNTSDADQEEDIDGADGSLTNGKKLQNSVAGLLTRFLPTIEAFFVVNASCTSDMGENRKESEVSTGEGNESQYSRTSGEIPKQKEDDLDLDMLVGGRRLIQFVAANKVLLNALLRSNPALLEKGLRAMVQVPKCRPFLDFDVKRQWFKTQVRRLRQHASRRHGSLRLTIRRKHVFEDAFHRLRLRTADEMRGRLHITFVNEEGVDAGGLSREFFGILAKEMFNPNYALFTSTEDGCTFQPNPNSNINPDHLSYFRFVGRIVGKAVVDGFLLDAHFTRSLYKHMLGVKPTHHDMQAIDPDYYKNLKLILEHKLDDIGVELTFSTEDHSFGRSQTIDLIENGRNIVVTEKTKEKYVSLVCQHRMTTAIQSQIKAYLEGFHELVKPDLISIFTAKELELLISGMPDIDIDDLKKNTDYQGWKATDKEIGWFWSIMFSLCRSEKAAFLQFATGSSKVPLAGFAELQGMRGTQKFSIHKAGGSSGALMSAHTCFNALDLPVYKSEEEMKEKLLYAISEGGGGFLFA